MKLYVGSRDYKPEGWKTLDIDDTYKPDFCADICDMSVIKDESVSELMANAILEHLDWPKPFKALTECGRVLESGGILKVSVPDLRSLCAAIAEGRSKWYATALLFGVGGLNNKFEAHRFGFTKEMMLSMLRVTGFSEFEYFNSEISDSTNAWMYDIEGEKIGCSLNIKAKKVSNPIADVDEIYRRLLENPMENFEKVAAMCVSPDVIGNQKVDDDYLFQSMAFELIDAKQRIKYLENLTNIKNKIHHWSKRRK